MSEEQIQTEEKQVEVDSEEKISIEQLQKELEDVKSILKGQDRKNTELQKEKEELKKILETKEKENKSVEERIADIERQYREDIAKRDAERKLESKKSLVLKEIASNGLNPDIDFDYVFNAETEEGIQERARKLAEHYENIKAKDRLERTGSNVPARGNTVAVDKFSKMNDEELMTASAEAKKKGDFETHDIILAETKRRVSEQYKSASL